LTAQSIEKNVIFREAFARKGKRGQHDDRELDVWKKK
jgi:hypothetical protein